MLREYKKLMALNCRVLVKIKVTMYWNSTIILFIIFKDIWIIYLKRIVFVGYKNFNFSVVTINGKGNATVHDKCVYAYSSTFRIMCTVHNVSVFCTLILLLLLLLVLVAEVVAAAAVVVVFLYFWVRISLHKTTQHASHCPKCVQWPDTQTLATVNAIITAVCQVKPSSLQGIYSIRSHYRKS
jgi:hypothetical protein